MSAGLPSPDERGLDLRALALILDAGRQAADRLGDPALTAALGDMAEVAAQLHLNPDGELFNLERDFTAFAAKLT